MHTALPQPRRFRDESDLDRMLALLQAGRAARIESYYPHTGDLKWWLYYPPLDGELWQHTYLWDDPTGADRLLGWAMLDPYGETYDVYSQPELYGTADAAAMYAWTEETFLSQARTAGRKQCGVFWVTPEDSFRSGWLEARGYQVTNFDPALARDLAAPIPAATLPAGFEVRSCKGLEEVEARALAQFGAFGSSANFELYRQRFKRFMQSPAYSPAADVVAAAPGGQIAAFCITWIDALNQTGLFEPVGTHPDFQRKGLARAVMLEALCRLQSQGVRQAIICTGHRNSAAIKLYESLGFQQYSTFYWYSKILG